MVAGMSKCFCWANTWHETAPRRGDLHVPDVQLAHEGDTVRVIRIPRGPYAGQWYWVACRQDSEVQRADGFCKTREQATLSAEIAYLYARA